MNARRRPSWRYARLAKYPARQWRWLCVLVLTTVGFVFTTAAQPWPLKILVDNAIGGERVPDGLRSVTHVVGAEPTPGVVVVVAGMATLLLFALSTVLSVTIQWG